MLRFLEFPYDLMDVTSVISIVSQIEALETVIYITEVAKKYGEDAKKG
jgi:hypothetical protein